MFSYNEYRANRTMILKALLSRLLFFGHASTAILLLHKVIPPKELVVSHWVLFVPLGILFIETCVTVIYRKGLEYTYIWPAGFLYITSLMPIIWITELRLLEQRITKQPPPPGTNSTNHIVGNIRCFNIAQTYPSAENGLTIDDNLVGKKVCELGLVIGLIVGRWLMPRGKMSRDQLSALLLGYVGNAADILELFESFEITSMKRLRAEDLRIITIAVMVVYTWSLYQFSLVTTATMRNTYTQDDELDYPWKTKNKIDPGEAPTNSSKSIRDSDLESEYIKNLRAKMSLKTGENKLNRGKGRKIVPTPNGSIIPDQEERVVIRRKLHGEVFQIVVSILMQDGPFLIVRFYLMTVFHINSEMYLFFMCKNAVMVLLLIYRLLILSCRGHDEDIIVHEEDASMRLKNTQVAVHNKRPGANEKGYCTMDERSLYNRQQSLNDPSRPRNGSRPNVNEQRSASLKSEGKPYKRQMSGGRVQGKPQDVPQVTYLTVNINHEMPPQQQVKQPIKNKNVHALKQRQNKIGSVKGRGGKSLQTISQLVVMDDFFTKEDELFVNEDVNVAGDRIEEISEGNITSLGTNQNSDNIVLSDATKNEQGISGAIENTDGNEFEKSSDYNDENNLDENSLIIDDDLEKNIITPSKDVEEEKEVVGIACVSTVNETTGEMVKNEAMIAGSEVDMSKGIGESDNNRPQIDNSTESVQNDNEDTEVIQEPVLLLTTNTKVNDSVIQS